MINPPSAGPVIIESSKVVAFQVTALVKISVGTICGRIAARAGRREGQRDGVEQDDGIHRRHEQRPIACAKPATPAAMPQNASIHCVKMSSLLAAHGVAQDDRPGSERRNSGMTWMPPIQPRLRAEWVF